MLLAIQCLQYIPLSFLKIGKCCDFLGWNIEHLENDSVYVCYINTPAELMVVL